MLPKLRRKPPPSAAASHSLAILMVGDGLLATAMPRRHVLLWSFGPEWWTRFVRRAAERPMLIRLIALGVAAGGAWWARRIVEVNSPR